MLRTQSSEWKFVELKKYIDIFIGGAQAYSLRVTKEDALIWTNKRAPHPEHSLNWRRCFFILLKRMRRKSKKDKNAKKLCLIGQVVIESHSLLGKGPNC